MPNHVCNKVEFHGEPNDVKAVLNLIAGDNGEAIDFRCPTISSEETSA